MTIPKIIHQTAFRKTGLDRRIEQSIAALKSMNPQWEHRLYDDDDARAYIADHYGAGMACCFDSINPDYGAAKADLFRYLVMYREGGVYIDIKSTVTVGLDTVLSEHDSYLLSHWRNGRHEEYRGWGLHPDCGPRGEYQNWHIVAAPRHPFLAAVIERVRRNIETYDVRRDGVGRLAVVNLTGPVPYTRAIQALEDAHPCRKLDIQEIGFRYSIFGGPTAHRGRLSGPHYTALTAPVVRRPGAVSPAASGEADGQGGAFGSEPVASWPWRRAAPGRSAPV